MRSDSGIGVEPGIAAHPDIALILEETHAVPRWAERSEVGIPELTERSVDAFRPRELVASCGSDGSRTRRNTLQS